LGCGAAGCLPLGCGAAGCLPLGCGAMASGVGVYVSLPEVVALLLGCWAAGCLVAFCLLPSAWRSFPATAVSGSGYLYG